MAKRILVVPDIHGRSFWREPVLKYLGSVDRIVFLGDYLDPYPDEGLDITPEQALHSLMDIIKLKKENTEKVILLKGNHDQHYSSKAFHNSSRASRCDIQNYKKYNNVFNEHKGLFQLAYLERTNDITYVFSHAGLTTYWINQVKLREKDL